MPENLVALDAIDRKILTLLQQNSSYPLDNIAGEVGLSRTPCWNRIRKLEDAGVISNRVVLLDQDKVNLGDTVFLFLSAAEHSRDWLNRFSAAVHNLPEIIEAYRLSGKVDYLLKVVVANTKAYDAFYKKLIARVPLANVTSSFAMERIKNVTALPL